MTWGTSDIFLRNFEGILKRYVSLTRHKRKNISSFHLFEVPRLVKFVETESRTVAMRGRWEGEMGNCLMGLEFQIEMMKKLWGWRVVMLHYNVNEFNATELYTKK